MGNRIQSAWIPPHMSATMFASAGCKEWPRVPCSGAAMWNYAGGYADMGPGQYPSIGNKVGNKNAEALKITTPKTWDDFLDACCRGVPGNGVSVNTCGPFWRSKSEQETGMCDFRVQEYCRVNPADPFCACYGAKLTTSSNIEGGCKQVAPKCYSEACTSGYAYRPNSQLKDVCIPCKICKQTVTVTGNANMFNDNVILMDCSGGSAAPSSTPSTAVPTTTPGVQSNVNIDPSTQQSGNVIGAGTTAQAAAILAAASEASEAAASAKRQQMILFIIIIVAIAVWYGSDPDPDRSQYNAYPPPYANPYTNSAPYPQYTNSAPYPSYQ